MSSYIHGSQGKIGSLVQHYCQQLGVTLAATPEEARCWFLAIPSAAVAGYLAKRQDRLIVDLSGYCKQQGIGTYAQPGTQPDFSAGIIQNPGCFAASIIEPFRYAGLAAEQLDGPVSITLVGGASVAHRSQQGGLRLSKRLWDHPHVKEIQRAIPGLTISSFVPLINHFQPHGICSVIHGKLRQPLAINSPPPFDLQEVLGGFQVKWSWQADPSKQRFVLGAVLDNLHFPAYHAALIGKRQEDL